MIEPIIYELAVFLPAVQESGIVTG